MTPTPLLAQVGAQRRRRSRAGRTWSRCRARCPGVAALPRERGDEDELAAAALRPSPGSSPCASTIGARRLTSSARSISCTEKSSSAPGRRQRGVGDEDVHLARLADAAASTSRALGQVDRERAAAELRGQRLEHVGAATRQDQLRAAPGERARDRLADAPCGARSSTVEPEICTKL